MRKFRFIDLFAGIGGMRLPFDEMGGHCVFSSELNRFCRQTYQANYPITSDHTLVGDIKPFSSNPWKIPTHDLLLAGFPCQPFSRAGVSSRNARNQPHGFLCETQGTLFFDLVKIIDHHRPGFFLLENVRHLENHDKGNTFSVIKHQLVNVLGYNVFHEVIDSSPWVPQKRKRIFIVGIKQHDLDFDFNDIVVPAEPHPTLESVLEKDVESKYTLTAGTWNCIQQHKNKHSQFGSGFGYSLFNPPDVARTLTARYYKDGAEILIMQKGNRPRRLTPTECIRIMGFKRLDGTLWNFPVSDVQAYKQLGNAVVVPVVRAIARLLVPLITGDDNIGIRRSKQQRLSLFTD